MVKEACTAPTHSIPGSAEALKQNNTRPMMESQLQIPAVLPWPFPKLQSKAEESPAPPHHSLLLYLTTPCWNDPVLICTGVALPGKERVMLKETETSCLCVNQRLPVRHPSTTFHPDPFHHFDNQNCSPTLRKCLPGSRASSTELINPSSSRTYLCLKLRIAAWCVMKPLCHSRLSLIAFEFKVSLSSC